MSRRCCDGGCHQGRTCPLRTVRIPTHRSLLSRAVEAVSGTCEEYPWLPMVIALAALVIANTSF
jgi:hypothetical protein